MMESFVDGAQVSAGKSLQKLLLAVTERLLRRRHWNELERVFDEIVKTFIFGRLLSPILILSQPTQLELGRLFQ